MEQGDRPRLLLLDGHSMAYRAFFALPVEKFTTSGGQPTNAIFGFTSTLVNALRDERPTHVAAAFDVSRQTFRRELFQDYKANRATSPGEFGPQLAFVDRMLEAMGIATLRVPGFEADDIIASLTGAAEAEGFEVRIFTGDRDALQLVSENVTVLYFIRGVSELVRFTPERVVERYGLTPSQYPDFAALRGDPSDNLPSIPGIGEKTAANWIREFGSLAALLERAGQVRGKFGERLRDNLETVRLNRRLTELVRDVPLPLGLPDLRRRPYDLPALTALLDELEFRNPSLRERILAADPGAGTPRATADPEAHLHGTPLRPGELAAWLSAHATPEVTAGIATAQEWARGTGRVTQVALATADGFATAFDPADLTEVDDSAFAAWLADPRRPKALHDARSALRALAEHGWSVDGLSCDTALAGYLLRPGLPAYGLGDLSARYLGRPPPADGDLMAAAAAIRDLAVRLGERLREGGADELLHRVELPLAGLLARIERTGVHVDRNLLTELEGQFADGMKRSADEAALLAGRPFNPGSTKQLQEVLFDELGLPRTKKIKSGHSTDADALAWLARETDHPLPAILLRHRDQARLRSQVAGLIKEIGADGRIHTTFQQTVAATGRITSTEPNLQVIPIRTAEGRQIRAAFIPGPGFESLMTADYGQLELRIMAHLSGDESLMTALTSGEDLHTTMAAQVFGVAPGAVDADMRRKIKAMSYGLAYGLSAFGLARQLGIALDEARPLMDAYFDRFGKVRDFLQHLVAVARRTGYTETMLGRRRYLPALTSENRQRREEAERMALNAPIQGSAADLVKVAMLRLDEALRAAGLRSRMLLQLHDEIVLEVAPAERSTVMELVRTELLTAHPLRVPLEVAIGTGPTWDAAAH